MSFQATPHIFQSGKIRLLGGAIDSKWTPQSIGQDLSRVLREAFTPRDKLNLSFLIKRTLRLQNCRIRTEYRASIKEWLKERKYVGSFDIIIPVESAAFMPRLSLKGPWRQYTTKRTRLQYLIKLDSSSERCLHKKKGLKEHSKTFMHVSGDVKKSYQCFNCTLASKLYNQMELEAPLKSHRQAPGDAARAGWERGWWVAATSSVRFIV